MPEASTANGTQLIQWDSSKGSLNAQWDMIPAGTASNGYPRYVFRNRWSRQCMDVDSTAVHAPVVQRPCDNTISQKWTRESPAGTTPNYATITNQHSRTGSELIGGDTALGARLQQYHRTPGAGNAEFKITSFNGSASTGVARP